VCTVTVSTACQNTGHDVVQSKLYTAAINPVSFTHSFNILTWSRTR